MRVRPVTPEGVIDAAVTLVASRPGRVRLAVDGAAAAQPDELAAAIAGALAPRPCVHARADRFWRAASLRFENGRQDPDTWLDGWLDVGALHREVLDDFPSTGRVLPELRDPLTDRSLRSAPAQLPADGVVIVSGHTLLGRGLPFDIAIHVHLSPEALRRRTPASDAWTLPALARYEAERDPTALADLIVRADDPRHPALVLGT
jgi:hypothetical protein